MNSKISYLNDDIIYYNASITNNQNQNVTVQPVYAQYEENRTQPLLIKPDDYLFSVVRWTVPMGAVPLLIMEPLNFIPIAPFTTPNTNPDLINLSLCLTYWDGTNYIDFVSFINYQSQNNFYPPPSLPITLYNEYYFYVFSYQQLINMINDAFTRSFNNLKATYPAAPATIAPQFIYNSVTNLYTLYVQNSYQAPNINPADPTNPNLNVRYGSETAITIWLDQILYEKNFDTGFNVCYAGLNNLSKPDPVSGYQFNKNYRIIVENTGFNTNMGFTSMVSEFPVISNSSAFQNIVLQSNTLPLKFESINPIQVNTNTTPSSNNISKIVSDYTYDIFDSTNAISGRLGIVYTPSVYRFSNFISQVPLTHIDLYANWVDNIGQFHSINLPSHSTFSFKFMFVKKTYMNNLIASGMKLQIN